MGRKQAKQQGGAGSSKDKQAAPVAASDDSKKAAKANKKRDAPASKGRSWSVTGFLNSLAVFSSTLCIIDCVVLPALLMGLSLLGIVNSQLAQHQHHHDHDASHDGHADAEAANWLGLIHEYTHLIAFYFIVPMGVFTLTWSFLQHRRLVVLLLGLVGASLVVSSAWLPRLWAFVVAELPRLAMSLRLPYNWHQLYGEKIELFGSFTLLGAQLLNRRLCSCDDHPGHSHAHKKTQ